MATADDRGGASQSESPTGLFSPSERPSPAPVSRPSRLDLTIPPPEMSVIGRFAGYDVIGRLAVGGMAEILLARQPTPGGAYVVIKRILDQFQNDKVFLEMFLDEARLGAQLHHTNICQMHDCGKADGAHYIVMEWVNGCTLGKIIKHAPAKGGIPLRVGLRIIADVARGTDYAHNAKSEKGEPLNLIHRDVTPHNIMVSFHGEVKLLDFGIAKAEEQLHHTQTGVVKGKFAYMAPEQSMNRAVDHRADVFSLGLCLYEMLAGRAAYKRGNAASTIAAVVNESLPPLPPGLPDTDGGLIKIVRVAAAKNRDDRFESAAQFADALERYAQSIGGLATEREVARLLRDFFPREFADGPEIDIAKLDDSSALDAFGSEKSRPFKKKRQSEGPGGMREFELDDDASYGEVESLFLDIPRLEVPGQRKAPTAASAPRTAGVASAATATNTGATARSKPRSRGLAKAAGLILTLALIAAGSFMAVKHWPSASSSSSAPKERLVSVSDNPLLLKQGARISITSTPLGAEVLLNGEVVSETPTTLQGLNEGSYTVTVLSPGYAAWEQTVHLGLRDTLTLTAPLVPKKLK